MSAHVQSVLRHRFTVPAWLVAALIVAAIAIAAVAALGGSGSPSSAPAATHSSTVQPTVCVDSAAVGHC